MFLSSESMIEFFLPLPILTLILDVLQELKI